MDKKYSENRMEIYVTYKNWRGETSVRRILPQRIIFESNQWHREEQWLLEAFDLDKKEIRSFAMKDIKTWSVEPPSLIG